MQTLVLLHPAGRECRGWLRDLAGAYSNSRTPRARTNKLHLSKMERRLQICNINNSNATLKRHTNCRFRHSAASSIESPHVDTRRTPNHHGQKQTHELNKSRGSLNSSGKQPSHDSALWAYITEGKLVQTMKQ